MALFSILGTTTHITRLTVRVQCKCIIATLKNRWRNRSGDKWISVFFLCVLVKREKREVKNKELSESLNSGALLG